MEVSAQGLHELAVEAFRVGNRGRLSLCEALRVLSETRLFLDLGFPGLSAYADAFFQLRRAETFEYVRVANKLLEMTELREAFGQGKIGWSALKAITRVASVASQGRWIDFARKNGVERTIAEARDAVRRGRDAPRESSFGLPNLDQKLVLRFARSDMEKVRHWIEMTCATIAESTGAEQVSLEQAILFRCEEDMTLETNRNRAANESRGPGPAPGTRPTAGSGSVPDAGSGAGPDARPDARPDSKQRGSTADDDRATTGSQVGAAAYRGSPGFPAGDISYRAQLVYQRCPDCRKARMGTRDGFVEVEPAEIERYEGRAEKVVIDGPTPPGLRRKILAREAGRCGNPRCHHRADHCHHIRFRSLGGKTGLANEVAVCATCHALIHAGLLRVSGSADGELCWMPVGSGDTLGGSVGLQSVVAGRLPVLKLERILPDGKRKNDLTEESANEDRALDPVPGGGSVLADQSVSVEDLVQGLKRLGVPAPRSRQMIEAAIEALPAGEITEANVLRKAIASI